LLERELEKFPKKYSASLLKAYIYHKTIINFQSNIGNITTCFCYHNGKGADMCIHILDVVFYI